MNILERITEIFFPTKCGICGKLGQNICENCYNNLKKFEIKEQHKDIFFVYKYEDIIRKFIIDYKFNGKSYLYKTFSESLLKNKKVCKFLNPYDIIVAVPLHKKRLQERGYNQSELIAKDLAKMLNINKQKTLKNNNKYSNSNQDLKRKYNPEKNSNDKDLEYENELRNNYSNLQYLGNVLTKVKNTKPQSTKGLSERVRDVVGIYDVLDNSRIKGKKVLLFDDIYTTGSTANECKKVLLQAGAKEVGILALAKDYIN